MSHEAGTSCDGVYIKFEAGATNTSYINGHTMVMATSQKDISLIWHHEVDQSRTNLIQAYWMVINDYYLGNRDGLSLICKDENPSA
jgi:hypothetical protein